MKAGPSSPFLGPYVALLVTGLLIGLMLATMSLTAFERQWILFLSGILVAAVFAVVSRSASRRAIALRTAELDEALASLAIESQRLADAEKALARVNAYAQLVDIAMPAMLAYLDAGAIVRYHNHSFARWVGLQGNAINGRSMEQILGRAVHAQIEAHLNDALAGQELRYERTQTMASGEVVRLFVQYLPHFGANGKVAGVFAILTDITQAHDLAAPAPSPVDADASADADTGAGVAGRLIAALGRDEFCLYSQSIAPLGAAGGGASFCEVLLRLKEEEENLLPPGSFLPIAEEHGLLPEIDRWVMRNVLDAVSAEQGVSDAVYFINLSPPTVAESAFAGFVRDQLSSHQLDGEMLCFEFHEQDVLADPPAYRNLIDALDGSGCRFAVSGFGCDPASLTLPTQLHVNYLKLDGGIALGVLRSPDELAKVKAFNEAAHAARMHVVAQCVEDEGTRAALQRIGTDFAQGFGISMPRPMGPGGKRAALRDPSIDLSEAAE